MVGYSFRQLFVVGLLAAGAVLAGASPARAQVQVFGDNNKNDFIVVGAVDRGQGTEVVACICEMPCVAGTETFTVLNGGPLNGASLSASIEVFGEGMADTLWVVSATVPGPRRASAGDPAEPCESPSSPTGAGPGAWSPPVYGIYSIELFGGDGGDVITSGTGKGNVQGDAGSDWISVYNQSLATGGGGNDLIFGWVAGEKMFGELGDVLGDRIVQRQQATLDQSQHHHGAERFAGLEPLDD